MGLNEIAKGKANAITTTALPTIAPFQVCLFGIDAHLVFVVHRTGVAAGPVVGLDARPLFVLCGSLDDAALDLHRIRHEVHHHVGNPLVITGVRHGRRRKGPRSVETALFDPGRIFSRHGGSSGMEMNILRLLLSLSPF